MIRYYFYSLRDQLPLDRDWLITAHELRPDLGCREYRCGFLKIDGTDDAFDQGLNALRLAVERVMLIDGSLPAAASESVDISPLERPFFVAVVAAAVLDGEGLPEHQRACFERLQVVLGGLTLATNTAAPELTIERVWPMYLIGQSVGGQPPMITNQVIVEHGFRVLNPATDAQLEAAARIADARTAGSPVETYRYFERRAVTSAWHDGDYVSAVVNAAMATEILIKHSAWVLEWEATTKLDIDPKPRSRRQSLLEMKPTELIGAVLAPRLGGNWNAQIESTPVGCWRHNIARVRNKVVHTGLRPDEPTAKKAVDAINHIEGHLLDRLAANASTYPRTALLLAGQASLAKRGAWNRIAAFAGRADEEAPWLSQYLDWLQQQDPAESDGGQGYTLR